MAIAEVAPETDPQLDGPPLYLDNQATTRMDPRVLDSMLPYFRGDFGNPHSNTHAVGHRAADAVERARDQVAALMAPKHARSFSPRGATEANNLALKGVAGFQGRQRKRVAVLATEHKCVLEAAVAVGREGLAVDVVPVESDGLLDLDRLSENLGADTLLLSAMAANNEIGVLHPLAEIGALCKQRGVLLHTDCAQAAGKVPIDVQTMSIDLLSISGHKMYGPMGIGALYVRRHRPRVRLRPLFDGGGQERGMRSGTLPLPLCVGLGTACAIAQAEMEAEGTRVLALRERLLGKLRVGIPDLILNGHPNKRLPGNLNISIPGLRADEIMAAAPRLALSSGSACTSAAVEPSYVLRALGVSDALAAASVRIGLGRYNTEADIDEAAACLIAAASHLRGTA